LIPQLMKSSLPLSQSARKKAARQPTSNEPILTCRALSG
jgi:hypothetical protein